MAAVEHPLPDGPHRIWRDSRVISGTRFNARLGTDKYNYNPPQFTCLVREVKVS